MASVYNVTIEYKRSLNVSGSSRQITIVTDTIQSAMSIAKCQCSANEEVTFICLSCSDPYIDYDAIKTDD